MQPLHETLVRCFDAVSISSNCYGDIADLFTAIKTLAEEHSTIHGLASLGQHIANDWENMFDCEREELKKRLEALK